MKFSSQKLKSAAKFYIFSSGIVLNLILFMAFIYGVYKVSQLGVSFEDVVNKSADKIYPKAPTLANLIRNITRETNDEWVFSGLDVDVWSGKGAGSLNTSIVGGGQVNQRGKVISVSNSREFLTALKTVERGQAIKLMPGTYKIKQRTINIRHSGSSIEPITVMGSELGAVMLELDTLEGFYVDKPFWVFENLKIKGVCASDSQCEHAFHVVGKGNNVIVRNNIITDFNAAMKVNGIKYGTEYYYPDNGRVEGNSFFNHSVRDTGNPVTVLDIIAVNDWVVSDNLIADFIKGKSDRVSYAAFFKGNGARNTFERNLVICRLNLKPTGGEQVGVSFGGGGTSKSACRNQQCDVESSFGIVRHNLIMNCDDVAIYLNKSKDTEIYNNTLINTLGIDVRFPQSSAVIANNFLTGRIKNRNGGTSQAMNNIVVDLSDVADYYQAPMMGDFTLKNKGEIVDRGVDLQVEEKDFCGEQRGPVGLDIGAFEYLDGTSTCDPFGNK